MLSTAAPPLPLLPTRRPDLVIRPLGEDGAYVVKDPALSAYYHLGAEEYFLLLQLDGAKDAAAVCAAFEERFGQPLAEDELHEFAGIARAQGLLQTGEEQPSTPDLAPHRGTGDDHFPAVAVGEGKPAKPQGNRQSILHWRKSLFDPDCLFTWLEPRISFFWTRGFLALSAGCILSAVFLVYANRHQVAGSFAQALRWETALWVWLTLFAVTMLHESAHGLTCKHYGGDVHEIGFLMLMFMPCFYCNVSDAWLFKERSKRLWVTFAGGYFELFLWALAVFFWRLTLPGSFPNYLAFTVLAACGVQTLFNFNPLLKLDGYYLLSDWVEIPNLQQRALGYLKGQLRRLLWGAPRPADELRGRFLLAFGLVTWLYSCIFLTLMLWALFQLFWGKWGWLGPLGVMVVGFISTRGLFQGFSAGEVHTMAKTRHKRTVLWLLGVGGLAGALCLVELEDRASGSFRVRSATRAELRAPVAGFLKDVYFDEGDRVSPGTLVARLEVPDLESRLVQKQAEVREVQAKLRLLEIGPRPEEVAEQRRRVERMKAWRDLAHKDLAQARQALHEELARLDQQIAQNRAELDSAQDAYNRSKNLRSQGAVAEEQHQEAERKYQVARALLAQAHLQKRHREALGTREAVAGLDAEAELARRDKDLADAQATLNLLKAGTRPEEIQAEQARLARLQEEAKHLEGQRHKQTVTSPVPGLVTTARLKEKVGQYLREGDLICVVDDPACLEAEITLAEQDVARVRLGQEVALKARALPFEALATKVDRIAPAAGRAEVQSSVTIYCRLRPAVPLSPEREAESGELQPEMTGFARVYTGRRSIGAILLDRALRFLRTEFWW